MNIILKLLAILFGVIVILKTIIWFKTDEPISRLSILYLMSLIIFLLYKRKWSYFILLGITTFPTISQILYKNYSGTYPFDYTGSIYRWLSSFDSNLNYYFIQFPVYFSVIVIVILLIPASRKLYGFGRK